MKTVLFVLEVQKLFFLGKMQVQDKEKVGIYLSAQLLYYANWRTSMRTVLFVLEVQKLFFLGKMQVQDKEKVGIYLSAQLCTMQTGGHL